jgi:GWxTD domain-containing protein
VDKEAGYHYQYDVPLTGENQIPYSDLLLFSAETDAPLVRLFVHEGDSLYLNSLDKGTERAFIYCYRTAFDAADPPMRLIDRSVNKNMVYDTMFTLDIKEPFTLPGNGLYFIQSDTAEIDGISVLCENNHFPKLTTVEDIFEPIIYMSTREELEKIKRSKNKKSAFESYWLKIAKTEEKARKIIRGYYQKIEEANILFTTYKEGWKTDMGMIYIFFGAPDEVYNDGLVEKWYYSKQGSIPAVIFTFEKLRNVFSRQHFILLRKEEYQSLWYNRVDMWRKGLAFQF